MGSELTNMELDDLNNILHEISKGNTRDMSTFRDVILEMYGGMNIRQYQRLETFIRSDLGLNSDYELFKMNEKDKAKIIAYLH